MNKSLQPSDLIGYTFQSDEIQSLVSQWEQLEYIDEDDIKEATRDHRLSLMDRQTGLYLFFTDEESYRQRYGSPEALGSLVLARATFLISYEEGFSQYAGILPEGLGLGMTFDDAARALGYPVKSWGIGNSVAKARWMRQARFIDVSFCEETGFIKLISLAPIYLSEWHKKNGKIAIEPGAFVSLFGMPVGEFFKQEALHQFDLNSRKDEIDRYKEADFSSEFGLEFFFKAGSDFPSQYTRVQSHSALHFCGVRYRADLDFASSGFDGLMPFGIELDDPWGVVASKVGISTRKEVRDPLDGYQLWGFENYELHVLSSFLEDRVYRITLDARGCDS